MNSETHMHKAWVGLTIVFAMTSSAFAQAEVTEAEIEKYLQLFSAACIQEAPDFANTVGILEIAGMAYKSRGYFAADDGAAQATLSISDGDIPTTCTIRLETSDYPKLENGLRGIVANVWEGLVVLEDVTPEGYTFFSVDRDEWSHVVLVAPSDGYVLLFIVVPSISALLEGNSE